MILKCAWCECDFDSLDDPAISKHSATIEYAKTVIRCLD